MSDTTHLLEDRAKNTIVTLQIRVDKALAKITSRTIDGDQLVQSNTNIFKEKNKIHANLLLAGLKSTEESKDRIQLLHRLRACNIYKFEDDMLDIKECKYIITGFKQEIDELEFYLRSLDSC